MLPHAPPSAIGFSAGFSDGRVASPLPRRAPPPLVPPTAPAPSPPSPPASQPISGSGAVRVAAPSPPPLPPPHPIALRHSSYSPFCRVVLRDVLRGRMFSEADAVRREMTAMLRHWRDGAPISCGVCDLGRRVGAPHNDPLDLSAVWRIHRWTLISKDAAAAANAMMSVSNCAEKGEPPLPVRDAAFWVSSWQRTKHVSGFQLHGVIYNFVRRGEILPPSWLRIADGISREMETHQAHALRLLSRADAVFRDFPELCSACGVDGPRLYKCVAKAPGDLLPLHNVAAGVGLCADCAYVCECADGSAWCPPCRALTPEGELTACACGKKLCFICNKGIEEPQCWDCWVKT